MAVPAHDTRDFEFAQQFDLPIVAVVDPGAAPDVDRAAVLAGSACFVELGTAINSGPYDGLGTDEFKQRITAESARGGSGPAGGQLQVARLAVQPAALLGRAVSDSPRAGRRRDTHGPAAGRGSVRVCRSTCRTWTTTNRMVVPSRR